MKARILMLFCGLMLSSTVFADISYNYVEFGYSAVSVDVAAPLDGDGTGPRIFVSHELMGPFTAFAGFRRTDFSDDAFELDDVTLGLGWHHSLGKNASVFFDVAYLHTDINPDGSSSFDQDGYGMTLGYRAENQSPWEFIGTIDYVNVESGVEFGGGISLLYDVTRRFSVSGGVSYFDQSTMAHLGARYGFTRKN